MTKPLPQQVLHFGSRRNSRKRRIGAFVRSNRFTLAGAVLLAIVVPELLHPQIAKAYPGATAFGLREPEFLTSLLALLTAHVGLRKVGVMPLVNHRTVVLPTFLIIYAICGLSISFALGHVARYHLVTSCLIGILWYQFATVLRARTSFPRLAWVGNGQIHADLLRGWIDWEILQSPRLPKDVQGVVYDSHHEPCPALERVFARAVLRNIPVYDVAQLQEMTTGRVQLRGRPELLFGQLLPSLPYLRIKRVFDTALALPAVIIVAPVLALVALAIKVESPGPVLFRQRRMGYQGRVFTCFKLRSMRTDIAGSAFTAEHDPRVTRVGKVIRKWRIDELPQLFNIIRGDMSWIGPRPESLALARDYQREIPYYAYRHSVRPGISGWAAVHQGNVALVDAATRKLEYDFFYIKYFSVWLDFLVLLMTVRTIVTGFGSK